jgi:ABC-type glycerol-3-phosphate transport system substrate-binding protein
MYIIAFAALSCNVNETKPEQFSHTNTVINNKSSALRMMGHWYGEGKKETLVKEMVREFSLLHQEVEFQLEFPNQIFNNVPEAELYFAECDSIEGMIRKNSWPFDVLFCDQERYKRVGQQINDPNWGKTYLVDFSEETWYKDAHKNGLIEDMGLKERYGGIMPGPVIEGITNIMFVSQHIESLLGIKVKDLDMTISDFLSYAKAVYDYNNSHSEKITFFSTQYNNATTNLFSQLVNSAYGKTQPGNRDEGLKAFEEAYKALELLAQYNPISQNYSSTGMTYDAGMRMLRHTQCLFTIQPTWMILLWNQSNPEGFLQMRPCEIPALDNRTSSFYPGFCQVVFVVPKSAANCEKAKEFIKFISTTETADKWVKYSKCPTGMRTSISYTDFGQDKYEIFFRHIQKKYGNNQFDVNLAKQMFNKDITLNLAVDNVLNGDMNLAEAMRNIQKQIR